MRLLLRVTTSTIYRCSILRSLIIWPVRPTASRRLKKQSDVTEVTFQTELVETALPRRCVGFVRSWLVKSFTGFNEGMVTWVAWLLTWRIGRTNGGPTSPSRRKLREATSGRLRSFVGHCQPLARSGLPDVASGSLIRPGEVWTCVFFFLGLTMVFRVRLHE